jgi:NADH-quinone oxidoreductase subunit F
VQIYDRLERGEATAGDIDTLPAISDSMLGKSFCGLGDAAASPVISSVRHFRDEYVAHYANRGCPFSRQPALAA